MRLSPVTAASRRGFSVRGLVVALVLALALPALGFALWSKLSWSTADSGPIMHRVKRADFTHEITDRGNVESANNVDIRCDVKAKGAAGTSILEIVPEGTMAQPGDVLVRLDSSALDNECTKQQITCNNSEAALIQAQEAYDTALISKREYLEGTYKQQEQTIDNERIIAKEELSKALEYLRYSERLAAKGYIPQQQVEGDEFAVQKTRLALAIAETKLRVLRQFTKEKMMVQLESDIKTTRAKLKSQEASYSLDEDQLKLIESQIEKCVIKAPQAGQVVYANETSWRGTRETIIAPGELVRERQVVIRMPDSTQMQVVAKINEAKVTLVSPGMPATIRLDAFPDVELQGTVEKVDEFPLPTSWMASTVKEYQTTVQIHESPTGLRPGLTAEVRIRVEQLPDVIQVPVQAVFEHGNKYYCVTDDGGRYVAREVAVGSTNDKTVVIRDGLSEGEQVVLNAAAYRKKVRLPELSAEGEQAVARTPQRRGTPAARVAEPSPAVAGQPQKADSPAEMAKRMFGQLDKDGDGKLRLEELPERLRTPLQAADSDGDGSITRAEWTAAAGRFLKQGAGTPPSRAKP